MAKTIVLKTIVWIAILSVCLDVSVVPFHGIAVQSYLTEYDTDGDGSVSISDVTALLDVLAGPNSQDMRYDLDHDGHVSIADVTLLLDVLAGVHGSLSSAVREVEMRIDHLKQNASYSAKDVNSILAVRKAYNALTDKEKTAVRNLSRLEAAEAKMLTIFDFNEDSISTFNAGLYGANSQCQVQVGYTDATIGGVSGVGWYSTAVKEGAFLMEADYNGDGYANDDTASYIGTHYKAMHEKEAYQALLDAGYTTVTFNFYMTAEAGTVEVWSRFASNAFYWLGSQPFDTWVTVELPLDKFVATYNGISSDIYSLVSMNVNAATTLTTMYLTDVEIRTIADPHYDPVSGVKKAINDLKQVGAYNAEDVEAVLAARAAFDELFEKDKSAVDNVALLESAEAKMLSVKAFTSNDSLSDFDAGLYGGNSEAKAEIGFVGSIGGRNDGFAWFSSKYRNSAGNITVDDRNGDGYINDEGYFGTKIVPENERSAYKALFEAGYRTVRFSIYQTAETGSLAFFCRAAYENAFVWFGVRGVDEWITLEIPLSIVIDNYDALSDGTWFLFGGDVNTTTELTTVYISDITLKRDEADVFAADALTKYDRKYNFTEEEISRGLILEAASNEYESGQIIIRSNCETIRDYNVYPADFVSADGSTISKDHISFYSAYYNPIKNSQNGYLDGLVPDILIPIEDRLEYGDNEVPSGCNQSIWFTVYVPKDTVAGEYSATFAVTLNGKRFPVTVKLNVYGFELPDETHINSAFAIWGPTYGNDMLTNIYGAGALAAEHSYYEFMLNYRLAPTSLPCMDLSTAEVWVDQAVEYAARADVPCFSLPFKYAASSKYPDGWFDTAYMHDILSLLVDHSTEEQNVFDKLYAYGVVDEPDYTGQYEKARDFNAEMRSIINAVLSEKDAEGAFDGKPSVREGLKNLYTLITVGSWGRDLGDLGSNVTGYCPKFNLFDKSGNRTSFSLYQRLGKHIWAYGCNVPGAPYPTYQVDADLTLARAAGIMQMRYGIEGNLYWCTNVSKVFNGSAYTENWDPYETAYAFSSWPGDGYLVVNAGKYNPGTVTPYPTMRLEAIRDGQEDYEYLYLLMKLAAEKGVTAQVNSVLSTEYSKVLNGAKPTTDPDAMRAFRTKVAELILTSL